MNIFLLLKTAPIFCFNLILIHVLYHIIVVEQQLQNFSWALLSIRGVQWQEEQTAFVQSVLVHCIRCSYHKYSVVRCDGNQLSEYFKMNKINTDCLFSGHHYQVSSAAVVKCGASEQQLHYNMERTKKKTTFRQEWDKAHLPLSLYTALDFRKAFHRSTKSLQLPEGRRRCTVCVLLVSSAVPKSRAITHHDSLWLPPGNHAQPTVNCKKKKKKKEKKSSRIFLFPFSVRITTL